MVSPPLSQRTFIMQKRKSKIAKRHDELVLRPYPGGEVLEWKHFGLEFARLIAEVHKVCHSEWIDLYLKQRPGDRAGANENFNLLLEWGLIFLHTNHWDAYSAIIPKAQTIKHIGKIRGAVRQLADELALEGEIRITANSLEVS